MLDINQLPEINDFLLCETPQAWIDSALKNPAVMLIDHANCEKKAAASAMTMMHRYVDRIDLLNKMSRLAREELRHFEQVLSIMKKRGIEYTHLTASRYAAGMHQHIRSGEPNRLFDSLIVGAFIEARSCERFAKLAPYLDADLQKFYTSLLKSESRHFQDYLKLALTYCDDHHELTQRVEFFAHIEKELIESKDDEFRFHSGVYAA